MNENTEPKPKHTVIADIQWENGQQPLSLQFKDYYFSLKNGLEESQYVYIQHNQLEQRWQQRLDNPVFTIAETGFGTGLNFLAAWKLWQHCKPTTATGEQARLHFISTEKFPLSPLDLKKALDLWPELKPLSTQLIEHYPPQPTVGTHRLSLGNGDVILTLIVGDATNSFCQLHPCATKGAPAPNNYQFGSHPLTIDAWFLDGFSPAKNPDMWNQKLFTSIAKLSNKMSTFATFTAASAVRKQLTLAGFVCTKDQGFGGKREMLYGCFQEQVNSEPFQITAPPQQSEPHKLVHERGQPAQHYWHLQESNRKTSPQKQRVLVIGGGLAGCHAAHALAIRNFSVHVMEEKPQLASAASGNRQGVVYTKLSPHGDALSRFNLSAQIYANHFYAKNLSDQLSLFDLCGDQCGVLHLANTAKQQFAYQQLADHYQSSPQFCKWLNIEQASAVASVQLNFPGLFIPGSGWLNPASTCSHLLSGNPELRQKIQLTLNSPVSSLIQENKQWLALDAKGNIQAEAEIVIVANASDAKLFSQTATLPLKGIRGQVSHLHNAAPLQALRTVVCGEGYIAPAIDKTHCVGASFNLNDLNESLSPQDHDDNLLKLGAMMSVNEELLRREHNRHENNGLPSGRVGFRSTTRDYFPIVGPVFNSPEMTKRFAKLKAKANATIEAPGSYHSGLYTLVGLGSRGLSYAPLAAELLASLICGEALPVNQTCYQHLHPARFLIRDLIRNKASTL